MDECNTQKTALHAPFGVPLKIRDLRSVHILSIFGRGV